MLITDVRYFKPQVITAIFRANDIIKAHEEVAKLAQLTAGKTSEYSYYVFAVQYKDFRTQRHAPDHIRLVISDKGAKQAKRQVDFFERIAVVMKRRVDSVLLRFPVCYDAYYDEVSEQFHLMMEDFSQHFAPAPDNTPPTSRHREQLIDTLAILHAYWWDHPLLEELGTLPSEEIIKTRVTAYQTKLASIKKLVGKYLDPQYINFLEKLAGGLPEKHHTRLVNQKGLTIIHNRLLPENILHSVRDSVIVNWQYWTISIATDDLATMIPFNWSSDVRQFQEKQLLKRYYDTLVKRGVRDYSWADFEYDYKASLAHIIGDMLIDWTHDEHMRGHWRKMEAAIDSFIAMGGEEIY